MIWSRGCGPNIRALALLLLWLFVMGASCADSFDLSDDIPLPLSGFQQAFQPDVLIDDIKKAKDGVFPSSWMEGWDTAATPGDLRPGPALTSHHPLRASHVPLYQAFRSYRI
jgi:hypothetical protein